ncbi:MAG TPA: pyruvate formate-lyase-activating protein [Vicinamibacterales bacterium]|jgi:pyruvate formate lyase activating enzyme|nr:pyruvate formate-lyase-activating protein [Vicinamibacterales bacterium]
MSDDRAVATVSLEAKSPFELRVGLADGVPESDVRAALASGDMGFLHSFTTGATVDGPGVRVVAWTAGCMWRCLYCHNPDTWRMSNGLPVTVSRAAEELRKYRRGLQVMKGGFTLSGGEPLMQHRFAVKLFAAAKEMGIHTALDTNGYYGHKLSDAELDLIDLVLLDLKAWDDERHRRLTGVDPASTRDFAQRLATRKRPVWVRYVLVPGLTDDPGEIAAVARFAASLGNVARVDVLPFHQMGKYKWEKLGIPYTLADTEPATHEQIEPAIAAFRAAGLVAY